MIDESRLRGWVLAAFGRDLGTLEAIGFGADSAAQLWRAETTAGACYAVKVSKGGTAAGLVASSHLAARGVTGAAAPMRTRSGDVCSEHQGWRLSVTPWVTGRRAITEGMSARQWSRFGALLAQVHATPDAESLSEALGVETHTHAAVASQVHAVLSRLRDVRGTAESSTRTVDPLVDALLADRTAPQRIINALLLRADALATMLQDRPSPHRVLCHGDAHLGNLLLGPDDDVLLVDWDDAVLAPAERDLMFVLHGVLAFQPVTSKQQEWFFDGYGPAAIDPLRLSYYRCVRALEDVTGPLAEVLDVERLPHADRAAALEILHGVLSPTGLATVAMQSPPVQPG